MISSERPKARVPYISYKSLLVTQRSVRLERGTVRTGETVTKAVYDLVLSFAGGQDDLLRDNMGDRTKRVRYEDGKSAREGQRLLMNDLRQAKTDYQHNQILIGYLQAARDAQMGVRYEHVHDCVNAQRNCRHCLGNGADGDEETFTCDRCKGSGLEPCAFNWTPHRTSPDGPTCSCNPKLGDLNDAAPADRPARFVIHCGEETSA